MAARVVSRRDVSLHGDTVSYLSAGRRGDPLVLLVHGVGSQASTWLPVLDRLATAGLHAVAPDLPGHGRSAPGHGDYSIGAFATMMRDLLQQLGVGPATVVGHSMGGGIGIQFVHQFPAVSQRLVLVASGGLGTEAHLALRLATLPGSELVIPLVANRPVSWALGRMRSTLLGGGMRATALSDEVWRSYLALTSATGRRVFLATLRSVMGTAGQRVTAVGRLHLAAYLPVLLVSCDYDPAIPLAHARAAHAALPGSRLEILPGRSHVPHQLHPQRFTDLLVEFIESTG